MESASSLFGGKFTASYAHGCSSKSTFSDCIVSGKYTRVFCSNGGVFTMNLVYFHALYDVRGERVSGGLIERGWPWRVAFRFVDGQRRIGRSNGIKIPHANSVVRCGFVRRWFHRIDRSTKCFEQLHRVIPVLGETSRREWPALLPFGGVVKFYICNKILEGRGNFPRFQRR